MYKSKELGGGYCCTELSTFVMSHQLKVFAFFASELVGETDHVIPCPFIHLYNYRAPIRVLLVLGKIEPRSTISDLYVTDIQNCSTRLRDNFNIG